jgi:hypothetical protein
MPEPTTRRSRRVDDARHVYLWEDIPRDVWNAAEQKRRLQEIPSMKVLLVALLRKYAKKPLGKPKRGRNPLKLF